MRSRAAVWATAAFGVSAVLVAAGAVLVASGVPASADIISNGGALSLDATPGALSDTSMAPGDTVYWPISAELDASTPGELTLQVLSSEPLATSAEGLEVSLASCPDAWTIPSDPSVAPTCDGGAGHTLIPTTAFADISSSKVWTLGDMSAVSTMPMMATISLPADVPASLQGTSGDLDFGFTALGDTENASPSDPAGPPLASTGVDPTGPIFLGAGLLLAGLTLGRLRSRALRRTEERAS
jgi:hypothetical protein